MPHLIDIGVNLGHPSFDRDRDEVLARAIDVGVTRMILTGTSAEGSREAADLAAAHPGRLYATAGVHPHDASGCDDTTIGTLRALLGRPEVVAVGECGLDFNRTFSPRPVQRRWFEAQLELAAELGLPLFLHERDAADAMIDILTAHRDAIPGAVVHCFTGDGDTLRRYLDLDLHIGLTGWICDERRGRHLEELAGEIPEDRLMVETDAPFLVPRTLRPKPKKGRNEPAFLPHVVEKIAACTGRDAGEVAAATTRTAEAFFSLEPR